MPQYIFIYLGGEHSNDPTESKKHFDKYQQWLSALSDSVVSPAIPFKDTHTVYSDGRIEQGTTTLMSGMSILKFESMQAALEAARTCPFLEIKGTLEVSEMIEMSKTVN
ncbi:MAG: hypothetical protein P8X88_05450 [Gammaproteobacteria bacterium]